MKLATVTGESRLPALPDSISDVENQLGISVFERTDFCWNLEDVGTDTPGQLIGEFFDA